MGPGSATHPVMPNPIVLWKMSPLWATVGREGRAGARLWARGPVRRNRGAIGPKSKPGAAGGTPGPVRCVGRCDGPPAAAFLHENISVLGLSVGCRPLQRSVHLLFVAAPPSGTQRR
jgi:hypothetical protein